MDEVNDWQVKGPIFANFKKGVLRDQWESRGTNANLKKEKIQNQNYKDKKYLWFSGHQTKISDFFSTHSTEWFLLLIPWGFFYKDS